MNQEHAASISFQIHTFVDLRENARLNMCWTAILWKTGRESLNPNGPWLCSWDWTFGIWFNHLTPFPLQTLPPSFQGLIQTLLQVLKTYDWKKCPEISNVCFLFNFDEKETNSSRLNWENTCWQIHKPCWFKLGK